MPFSRVGAPARAALRAAHARDAPGLRHRRHDVPALLAAHRAELLHTLTALMNLIVHAILLSLAER